ncbi:hypothetical protein [Limnoglobus roseus]|uniref:Uncharacterized protein n=1 Tax=Limnoglobus roseus TaxID=2598579 RepID=A0A5C1A458_9BACT|nr:hypothetical protein [Limnoglobus roseus]QEL13869.1 hypothetical protein PX52LOC_00727 [Limnoglobus roseus]
MAIINMTEMPRVGSIDEQGYRSYRREWLVETDDVNDGPRAVANAVGLAYSVGLYSQYNCGGSEVDLWARCKSQSSDPVQGQLNFWKFIANYDSKPFDNGTGSSDLNAGTQPTPAATQEPTLRPLMVKSVTVEVEEALTTDYSMPSKKVRASNGQAFSPPVMRKRYIPGITITTWLAYAPWGKKADYTGAVNNDTFLGFAPNTLKCTGYEIQSVFEQNLYYYQIDLTFLIGDPDWDVRVLDCGTYEYISTTMPNEKIKDSQGNFVTDPVPLDGSGRKLPLGDALVYLLFKDCKQRAFNSILTP